MRSAVIAAALIAPFSASAADIDLFNPGSSTAFGVGTLQGEAPVVRGEGPAAGLLTSFAQDPVVRSFSDGREEAEVSVLLPVTLYGGYTIADTARIDLFVPIYAFVDAPMRDFQGPAAGDLRIQSVIPVFADGNGFGIALVPRVGLPTGTANALTRQGLNGGLMASLGGEIDTYKVGYLANVGITGAAGDDVAGVGVGSSVDSLVGGYYRATEAFRLGAEVDLRVGLAQGTEGSNTASAGHLFAQDVLDNGLAMTLGAGTGLLSGLGSPDYRVFVGISWARFEGDRDRDGLADADDACPNEAEDLDGFRDLDGCPDTDNDADGVADASDECPDAAEDFDGFRDLDGCPEDDNDSDGLADADDACPNDAGDAQMAGCPDSDSDGVADNEDVCRTEAGAPESEGCPDADGDWVADYRDACADEVRPKSERVELSDGCDKEVWFTKDGIAYKGQLEFMIGRSTLRSAAKEILNKVVAFIQENPDLGRIEIGAHTDNQGEPDRNLDLSPRRAETVRDYLVQQGLADGTLIPKGYGHTKPIDTNRTERGRANNRRVVLILLDQAEQTAAVAPAPAPAPPPPTVDEAGDPGTLSVVIKGGGWANVYIDDQRLTKGAPFTDFPIAAGPHKIWVANDSLQIDWVKQVHVANGAAVRLEVPSGPVAEIAAPSPAPPPAPVVSTDALWQTPPVEKAEPEDPWRVDAEEPMDEVPPPAPADGKRPPRKSKKR